MKNYHPNFDIFHLTLYSVGNIENSVALVEANKGRKKTDLYEKKFLNLTILLKFGYKSLKKIYLKVQFSDNNTI
jgi:hypothetical protein